METQQSVALVCNEAESLTLDRHMGTPVCVDALILMLSAGSGEGEVRGITRQKWKQSLKLTNEHSAQVKESAPEMQANLLTRGKEIERGGVCVCVCECECVKPVN